MQNKINKEFKKSSINAKTVYDYYQIQRKSNFLTDCIIKQEDDVLKFEFSYEYEKKYSEVKLLSLSQKYQALINIRYLIKDIERLHIKVEPDNLIYDVNMMPKAIMRDIYLEETYAEEEFIKSYKSLIGYVLQNKYKFQDYYQGGNQLLSKNKITALYAKAETIIEIVNILQNEYEKEKERLQNTSLEVDKKKYKRLKVGNRILVVVALVCIAISGYFGGYVLFQEKTFNKANEEYIKQDYISVIDTLKKTNVTAMNKNTKYILAVSNVKVESLNDKQKNNILSGVSLSSDERILEFWIYLGKSEMDAAIDIAKQLGDEQYMAYGYMKEKSQVENDKKLNGAQREEKLKSINDNLKGLTINKENDETTNGTDK